MKHAEIKIILSGKLTEKRYRHTLGVSAVAEQLARRYGVPTEKASLAGLLHDCAREFSTEELFVLANKRGMVFTEIERYTPVLLHAWIGAELAAEKYGVADPEISRAIRLHTTGGAQMSKLDRIIYLADMIEPGRDFPAVASLRQLAERDLDQALLAAFDQSILYVIKKGQLIHPDTILARNEILLKG